MPEQKTNAPKTQLSVEEYLQIKEKRAKSRLALHFPLFVRLIVAVPAAYFLFLIIYFVIYLRFFAQR